MHPVATGSFRQIGSVVQDNRDVMRPGDGSQPRHGGADLIVRGLLEPDLQGGDRPRRQGLF
ncbi:hypothetical protein D3C81_2030180 [compost metagenome]